MAQSPVSTRLEFFPAEAVLIQQGGTAGTLFVLRSGSVEVERSGQVVGQIEQPGSVIGEMSLLLDVPHSASVRALTDVEVYVIEDAVRVLEERPAWALQLARMLAQRLNATTGSLVAAREERRVEEIVPTRPTRSMLNLLGDPQV